MPKDHKIYACKRDLMREQLAHQAARLMAENGITDHALAKRKAARQLAVPTHEYTTFIGTPIFGRYQRCTIKFFGE